MHILMKQLSKPWVTRAIPKSTYDEIDYIQIPENKDILLSYKNNMEN